MFLVILLVMFGVWLLVSAVTLVFIVVQLALGHLQSGPGPVLGIESLSDECINTSIWIHALADVTVLLVLTLAIVIWYVRSRLRDRDGQSNSACQCYDEETPLIKH